MHTTIEEAVSVWLKQPVTKSMTAYVRMKDSAGVVRSYYNVKAIEWMDNALLIVTDDDKVTYLQEVFTCEIN